jgi:hypothetical protein
MIQIQPVITVSIFLLAIIFQLPLRAQEIIELDTGTTDFAYRRVFVSNVIDHRVNKESIGKVRAGVLNIEKNATFPTLLEATLMRFYTKHFPAKPQLQPVVLIVKELWIEEKIGTLGETGYAKTSFILTKKDSLGLRIIHKFEKRIEESGIDVTLGHERRIRELLKQCLMSQAKTQIDTPSYYTNTSQQVDTLKPSVWFSKLQKGVYFNFLIFFIYR